MVSGHAAAAGKALPGDRGQIPASRHHQQTHTTPPPLEALAPVRGRAGGGRRAEAVRARRRPLPGNSAGWCHRHLLGCPAVHSGLS